MDKNRILNYARYDLLINRAFYRNAALASVALVLAAAIVGFLVRWMFVAAVSDYPPQFQDQGYEDSAGVEGTVMMIATILGVLMCIFAGCIHHTLRSKQGRITVLTLPTTNAEKFLWHTSVTILGGALLCLLSVGIADLVNMLLSLLIELPFKHIHSLTLQLFAYIANPLGSMGSFQIFAPDVREGALLPAVVTFGITSQLWVYTTFFFGNALRKRYNVVFTILVLVALQIVISVAFVIASMVFVSNVDANTNFELTVQIILWTISGILMLSGVWMWVMVWKKYKQAQITDK